MGLETRPIGDSFAIEVRDFNLWEEPSAEAIDELRQLWSRHGVIVVRRQALSEAELVRFSACFGKVEPHVRTDWSSRSMH